MQLFRALGKIIEKAYTSKSTETAPESLDSLEHYLACVKKECGFMITTSAVLGKCGCVRMCVT